MIFCLQACFRDFVNNLAKSFLSDQSFLMISGFPFLADDWNLNFHHFDVLKSNFIRHYLVCWNRTTWCFYHIKQVFFQYFVSCNGFEDWKYTFFNSLSRTQRKKVIFRKGWLAPSHQRPISVNIEKIQNFSFGISKEKLILFETKI